MSKRQQSVNKVEAASSSPHYQLRAHNHGVDDLELEIWQVPNAATPHLSKARRIAGLRGRNLALVEQQVLRRLKKAGIAVAPLVGATQQFDIDEDTSMNLGLLCRVLAPMRNEVRMRQVATGIGLMDKEESAYWLGMAMHRKNPRRVLNSLRILLTTPK